MASVFNVQAIGVTVRIDLGQSVPAPIAGQLRHQWRHALAGVDAAPDVDLRFGVRQEAATSATRARDEGRLVSDAADLPGRIATDVTLAALEAQAGRRFLFHSCAVALDDGRVIGFAGRSGMGKTTIAEHLGRHFGYVTDEALCVDSDRSVSAYRKPLSIGHAPHPKVQRAAADLGMRIAPAAGLRLAALVLLDRRDQSTEPVLSEVPLVEALPEIAAHMSYFARHPSPLRSTCELLIRTGGVRRVSYSDAAEVAALVPAILARTQRKAPALVDLEPYAEPTARTGPRAEYRRAAYADALRIDGHVLVLHGSTITRLNELAGLVWCAATGTGLDRLTGAVTQRLGAAPKGVDASAVVERTIAELTSAGLLVQD
jgi:energy-coupling factor transporter ATP-binding protein EcfA2